MAITISCVGLLACGLIAGMSPSDRLGDPFTLSLCACAVLASVALVDLEGTLFWGGSLVPYVCAFSVLGPAPAVMVGVVGELAVWAVDRYRGAVFPLNLVSVVGPNLLAAEALDALGASPDGVLFYLAVLVVATLAVGLNLAMITALAGLYHGQPIALRLRSHLRLVPAIGINILVAIAAIAVYFKAGLGAALFALAGVLVFTYLARQVAQERDHLARISQLADERGALVARILEAEDRERRVLTEALHDDVLQAILAAQQDLDDSADGEEGALERAQSALREAVANARQTLAVNHPSALDRVGLAVAIATTAERHEHRSGVRIEVDVDPAASGLQDRFVYWATRELMTNVVKHAGASVAEIRIVRRLSHIDLTVSDDGVGVSEEHRTAALKAGHVGLASVEAQAISLGGSFHFGPRAGARGTTARVTVPALASAATSIDPTPQPAAGKPQAV